MGYVEQLMAKGEEIVLRARQHWVTLMASALTNAFIVIVVLVLYVAVRSIELLKPAETVLGVAALVGILFGLARFSWDWLRWWSEEYIVTSRRVIQSEGIVNKRTADSSLEKVNDVLLTQSAEDADYDIQLDDRAISRPHAKLTRVPGGFSVQDLAGLIVRLFIVVIVGVVGIFFVLSRPTLSEPHGDLQAMAP